MKRNSNAVRALLVFILLMGLIATADATEKKILRYGAIPMKSTLDMHLNTYNYVMDISDHIVESLLRYDNDMKLQPVLVKEIPRPSEDGLVYRFELKPDVRFHDGTTLKASDVKYSYERLFRPSTGALMPYVCDMIVGAQEMLNGKANSLEGFKIVSDDTFEITLAYPYAAFLSGIATAYAGIYPEKACEAAGKSWGLSTYIGTGPFKISELNVDTSVTAERFAEYHGPAPKLDGIEFVFIEDPNTRRMEYERGNIDVMFLDATVYPEYSKSSKLAPEIGEFTPLGLLFVRPNVKAEFLQDIRVREAISLAIDRDTLALDLMKGTVKAATTFIPPGMLGHDKNATVYEYNLEKAKTLLAEAGYSDGFSIEAIIRNTAMTTTMGRVLLALQPQLKKAGIDMKITQVDAATSSEMRNAGKIPFAISIWYADYPDPDGFIYSTLYSTNAKTLSSNYDSPAFDKLLDDARSITDEAKREELYIRADRMATREDFAAIPLFNETMYYLCKPYVKNFKMTPAYIFHFFDVDIEK